MILDPWDPLVMGNNDGNNNNSYYYIKNPNANLVWVTNLSSYYFDHNSYLKKLQIWFYFD